MGRSSRECRLCVEVYRAEQPLPAEWAEVAAAAREACKGSYAPYSGFSVGAAVELVDGTLVQGANQENGAYPSGLCAERVAIFGAMARGDRKAVRRVAIAARRGEAWVQSPITPCGACRQVMLEVAQMQRAAFAVLMLGERESLVVQDARELLPLAFDLEG